MQRMNLGLLFKDERHAEEEKKEVTCDMQQQGGRGQKRQITEVTFTRQRFGCHFFFFV